MAETKTLNVRFQQKYDTAENWSNSTLTLMAGEMAVESDTGKFKFGDGEHIFAELPYAGVDTAQLDALEDNYYHLEPEENVDDTTALATIENPKKGDIAVCERVIGGVSAASSLTAYVYMIGEDGNGYWGALDGNYNAENVYFDEDLITSYAMGNVSLNNGAATIAATGKNLRELWELIYLKEINTELQNTAPSCSISGITTNYYLVGASSAAQTATVNLNKGSYDYGYGYVESKDETDPEAGTKANTVVTNDGTGVVATGYSLTYNGSSVTATETNGNKFVCASTSKTTAPAEVTCSGTVTYEKAGNPVSNLGNIYPAQAYPNGSKNASATPSRWYYPIYQGFTDDNNVITDHANITGTQLTTGLLAPASDSTKTTTSITGKDAYDKVKLVKAVAPGDTWRQYFLAYPKAYSYDMSAAKDSNNIDCTVNQAADVTLTFNEVEVVYAVYYIHNATAYGTKTITWTLN